MSLTYTKYKAVQPTCSCSPLAVRTLWSLFPFPVFIHDVYVEEQLNIQLNAVYNSEQINQFNLWSFNVCVLSDIYLFLVLNSFLSVNVCVLPVGHVRVYEVYIASHQSHPASGAWCCPEVPFLPAAADRPTPRPVAVKPLWKLPAPELNTVFCRVCFVRRSQSLTWDCAVPRRRGGSPRAGRTVPLTWGRPSWILEETTRAQRTRLSVVKLVWLYMSAFCLHQCQFVMTLAALTFCIAK